MVHLAFDKSQNKDKKEFLICFANKIIEIVQAHYKPCRIIKYSNLQQPLKMSKNEKLAPKDFQATHHKHYKHHKTKLQHIAGQVTTVFWSVTTSTHILCSTCYSSKFKFLTFDKADRVDLSSQVQQVVVSPGYLTKCVANLTLASWSCSEWTY